MTALKTFLQYMNDVIFLDEVLNRFFTKLNRKVYI